MLPAIEIPVVQDPIWLRRPNVHRQICDSIFTEHLLSDETFLQFVIQHDNSGSHAPTVEDGGVFRPCLSEDTILSLFQDVHEGNGRMELQNMFLNYGFIVIMDEWGFPLVYCGDNETKFSNWTIDYQPVTTSNAFFTQRFG